MLIPFRPPKTRQPYVLVNLPHGEFCGILNATRKHCIGVKDEHSRALIVADGTILALQGKGRQTLEFYIVRKTGNGTSTNYAGYLIRLQYHEIADQIDFSKDIGASHIVHTTTYLQRVYQPPMYDVDLLKHVQDIRTVSQVSTYLFPTRLREDFLKYHDNRTCIALSKNKGTGAFYSFDKRPIQLDDPEGTIYVIETSKNQYVAYHFVDNLKDDKLMLWGKEYCNLVVGGHSTDTESTIANLGSDWWSMDRLAVDGSLGVDLDDRHLTFHLNSVKSVNMGDNLRDLFETPGDSQRRDIDAWNKLIEANDNDIWAVDAYFDTRSGLKSRIHFGH